MILNKSEKNRRNTPQRAALLELLASVTCHPGAAWLHEQLVARFPDMSLATVYRNLSVLADEGQIRVLRSAGSTDRFDGNTGIHYHVVCSSCGSIVDVPAGGIAADDLIRSVEEQSGFSVFSYNVDFYGICPDCRSGNHTGSLEPKN